MDVTKLSCFKHNSYLSKNKLINQLYKDVDTRFFFLFMKKTYKMIGESFKYSRSQIDNILVDLYYNKGQCAIFLIDYFPKNISTTTEIATNSIMINKLTSNIEINSFFKKEEFQFFYNIFWFLFYEKLEIKSKKLIYEMTSWFYFNRIIISELDYDNRYKYNQKKRDHWINILTLIRKNYGKNYNEIIININNSFK